MIKFWKDLYLEPFQYLAIGKKKRRKKDGKEKEKHRALYWQGYVPNLADSQV